jgi:succinyl-CoA synthetase beta subunit
LFEQYGIPVPKGELVRSAEQAARAAAGFGGPAVVKGQVLTGGRGKAGAIKVVSSQAEAEAAAGQILGMRVKGFTVEKVLVTERLDIKAEYYCAITVDRQSKAVILVISAAGGMDIEEIAEREPQKIRRFVLSSDVNDSLGKWLEKSFEERALLDQSVKIAQNMNRLFRQKDCSLVEINPLAVTGDGRLIAADAKIVLDDNGVPQHPELAALRNPEEYTADETEAREAGLSFVSLSGQIGCMVNGAGLAMATMDCIKRAVGSPANFLDVGGSSNPQKVLDAMRILLRNEQLKVILVNIFGGITRCDDVAQGILWARDQLGIELPIVIRLIGTNEQKGRDMLKRAGLIATRRMNDAIEEAVACAKGGAS